MIIYGDHYLNKEYYCRLESEYKEIRTKIIEPDEKHLDKEVPIRVLKKFSDFFKSNKQFFLMYETNIYIADKLFIDKHYESSVRSYMKVLKEVESLSFYNKTPHIYNRIGICEFKKFCYNDALMYYKKAKLESSRQSDKETYIKASYNIAVTYFCLKDYCCAKIYIDEVFKLCSRDQTTLSYVLALILKANLFIVKGFNEKALDISKLLIHNINQYDNSVKEHIYLFLTDQYYKMHSKNAVYYGELGLRCCMATKNYDLVLYFYKTLDGLYRYYHEYLCCYNNLNSFIKFMSDKCNRKFSNIFSIDMFILKIKIIHYRYLSLSKSSYEV